MKICVKAKTRAKRVGVTKIDGNRYKVAVASAPEKGRANESIIRELATHFGVSRSKIKLLTGQTSTNKIFDVRL